MKIKSVIKVALLLLLPFIAKGQQSYPDSLRTILQNATTDMARNNASVDLYFFFLEADRDSALFYAENRLTLARKNKMALVEAAALTSKGYQYIGFGKYSEAFQNLMQALRIAEDPKTVDVEGWNVTQYPMHGVNKQIILSTIHHVLGQAFHKTSNYEQEIIQMKLAVQIASQINHPDRQMVSNMNLGSAYLIMGQLDSAIYYAEKAKAFSKNPLAQGYIGNNLLTIGDIFLARGDTATAKKTYYEGLESANRQNNQSDVANLNHKLFRIYFMAGNKDSTLNYALKNRHTIASIKGIGHREINMGVGYEDLSQAYQLNKMYDSAYKYQGIALITKDSLYQVQIRNIADFQKLLLGEALRLENLEKEKIQTQSRIRSYGFLAGLGVLTVIGLILYRNNRQKQKANGILQEQKDKVVSTLHELKSTQAQLIQSEKMASLGELTAGIAHEIQNPLNFVNNFSELNKELVLEATEELGKGDFEEAKAILKDIGENSEKINHHGKRADAIVKGMLAHSRTSTGEKVPTDINALADEYLRLSYHGLRAKDNSFNADYKTDFDPNLPKINVVPQKIGRVLLNIINNAFQAVGIGHALSLQPMVTVSTKNLGDKIEISISDNGPGIPDAIKDKIFQPFFTTKPTGQGTGLGLSLSYDIVKAHGGELTLDSNEEVGTQFTIKIPIA